MTTSGPSDRDGNVARGEALASLEQVREILYGAHARELERKLLRVDAHLAAEAEELRKEMRRRLGVLEAHVQRESDALVARFESERAAHVDALANMGRESREAITTLEQRVTKMEEALARAQRELRQQVLDQAKAFVDETQRTRDEVVAMIEREVSLSYGDEPSSDEPRPKPPRKDVDHAPGH
jgi:hypothetical protein